MLAMKKMAWLWQHHPVNNVISTQRMSERYVNQVYAERELVLPQTAKYIMEKVAEMNTRNLMNMAQSTTTNPKKSTNK
uniref:Uncharacterized protein n=1 Tax=Romanomermis culicivorax TaxID=13658 RepID=A0A915IYF8_ROMCU